MKSVSILSLVHSPLDIENRDAENIRSRIGIILQWIRRTDIHVVLLSPETVHHFPRPH